ncbi:MAG: AMP-binding protein [Bacilli bacterium]|nr:AMP-binding protein [Bacilli bacterium]
MYPEYNHIKEMAHSTASLLETSRRMQDIFDVSTKKNAKKIAVVYRNAKGKKRFYTYSRARAHTYVIASILDNLMIQRPKNKPIVLKAANGPHWCEIFWAILMCGYKPLLVDAKATKEGTENLIKQAKAAAIITDDNYSYNIPKFSLNDILADKKYSTYGFSAKWENEVIFCSSGTTGDVKLMVYNGENLINQIVAAYDMCETTKDIFYPKRYGQMKMLSMLPLHHIFGFAATFLWYFYFGASFIFPKNNAPTEIQKACQNSKVTHVYCVPLFWDSLAQTIQRKKALLSESKQENIDKLIGYNTGKVDSDMAGPYKVTQKRVQKSLLGRNIRFCISGGGYLDGKTQTIINGVGYPLYNGYGMTEIGVTSVELTPDVVLRLRGSIGIPLHGVSYKILPQGNDQNVGELLVKSPITHIREIIGGVEKEANVDKDGYFHTGDIAEKDATNRYYLKGRIKDVIINSDGENIFPDELEFYFKDVEKVQQLCVLGINEKGKLNQKIVGVFEIDNKTNQEELEGIKVKIKEIGTTGLPKGVKISDFYFSRGKLPTANNMKVKRFVIKEAIESRSKEYIPFDLKKEPKKIAGIDPNVAKELVEKMRKIFSKILILPLFKIDDDAHWVNDLGGDSMSYVELLTSIQEEFKVTIPENLYGQLATINDFVEQVALLKKKK